MEEELGGCEGSGEELSSGCCKELEAKTFGWREVVSGPQEEAP